MSISGSGKIETIDSVHNEAHDGRMFVHFGEAALTAAGGATPSISHLMRIPANVYPKLRSVRATISAGDVKVYLYESPTVTLPGTVHSSINVKRYSTRTSQMQISHDPTIAATGTIIDGFEIFGTNQIGGVGTSGVAEFLLKSATDYLLTFTNVSNQALNLIYQFEFFEENSPEPEIP